MRRMTKFWGALRKRMTSSEVDLGAGKQEPKGDAEKEKEMVSDDGPEIQGTIQKHDYWRNH